MEELKFLSQGQEVSLEDILKRNEERQNQIYQLINKHPEGAVIKFSLNIPGPIKTNEYIKKLYIYGVELLKKELEKKLIKIVESMEFDLITGPEFIAAVDGKPEEVKGICIAIEESEVGRLFDFDVEGKTGPIGRENVNIPSRKCFLCGEDAKICRRNRNHKLNELLIFIDEMLENHIINM